MTLTFPVGKYEGLVDRILAGEVVFFVGAGFSLDSEGNSAGRLIARLMVRFMALTEELPRAGAQIEDLRDGLRRTFKLDDNEDICTQNTIDKLAARYYDINDWMTNAFETLLDAALELNPEKTAAILVDSSISENKALEKLTLNGRSDPVTLEAISIAKFGELRAGERGKALFLETLGFCQNKIMAGRFDKVTLEEVMGDFRGLVRERHRVLARLAREGLCPLLITTNYDLLLEGACRLAGFKVPGFSVANGAVGEKDREPPATYGRLTRIGAPSDFFASGAGFRSALLVKIHGCADRYRHEKQKSKESWSAYLPSIVFTYREIQNWRKDSWSRDLVSTLLRTRTMVLCGYSGADPVLHDTFRTVYEEIRAQNGGRAATGAPVRAYFTGSAASREFYGIEILRAASRAAGVENPQLTEHANYLPFYFLNQAKFPTMDEMLTWVGHRTMRGLQRAALGTDLRRIATQLLKKPVPETDLVSVRQRFEELECAEKKIAESWSDGGSSHWEFGRVAGWTDRFHSALLREFALAEMVQRNQGPGLALEHLRAARSYFPISDQPGWAAWGVVIEIALRRMLEAIRDKNGDWSCDHRWVEPAICEYPAVLFSLTDKRPSPACLLLRLAAFERPGYLPEIRGFYKRLAIWDLCPGAETETVTKRSPSARDLWDWATAPNDKIPGGIKSAREWLGES
jgi:hypothetical protein